MGTSFAGADVDSAALARAYRKVTLRLIPYLFVCYLFNYLDRVNVGFAKLHMLADLHLSETAFGLGAGIFFIGYILCGVPSNLMLRKVGARRWIAFIMVLWGLFSTSLMFVRNAETFFVLRLLIGATEAGFFPGIVLYFTRWFPSQRRGRIMALFMAAVPLSGVLGNPFSGWILSHFSALHGSIASWQWLFLLQGVPTILLGAGVWFFLNDGIATAKWLSREERELMQAALIEDENSLPAAGGGRFADVLANPGVWLLGFVYFCLQCGVYGFTFWLPTIIRATGVEQPLAIGWLSAIPYLAAGLFMLAVGRSADAARERRWHFCVPMLMGAMGLSLSAAFSGDTTVAMCGLTLAAMGAMTAQPMFWPLSGGYLSASAAVGGLAMINSLGQFGGFLSPYLVGWVKDTTHATDDALYVLAAIMLVAVVLVLRIPARRVNR
jgi:MFS family permease